jgi:hypothetical protein
VLTEISGKVIAGLTDGIHKRNLENVGDDRSASVQKAVGLYAPELQKSASLRFGAADQIENDRSAVITDGVTTEMEVVVVKFLYKLRLTHWLSFSGTTLFGYTNFQSNPQGQKKVDYYGCF